MALLPGYERLPGSARRVLAPDGSELSRRAYEDIVAREAGFRSWRDWQRLGSDPEYHRMIAGAVRTQGVSYRDARARGSELNRAYLAARRTGFGDTDASPKGPMARLLTMIGRRRADWQFAVGDTPPR